MFVSSGKYLVMKGHVWKSFGEARNELIDWSDPEFLEDVLGYEEMIGGPYASTTLSSDKDPFISVGKSPINT